MLESSVRFLVVTPLRDLTVMRISESHELPHTIAHEAVIGIKEEDPAAVGFADAGVGLVMNAGCSLESSRDIVAMAEKYPWLYASVGSHPDSANEVNE